MRFMTYLTTLLIVWPMFIGCNSDMDATIDKTKELQVRARLRIHDGKLNDFKTIATRCLKSVQEKDNGTLQYDWFFSEDRSVCIVRERYKDSEALLQHIANLGDALNALLSVSDLSVEIYGSPSPELLKATEGVDTVVYSYFQGF